MSCLQRPYVIKHKMLGYAMMYPTSGWVTFVTSIRGEIAHLRLMQKGERCHRRCMHFPSERDAKEFIANHHKWLYDFKEDELQVVKVKRVKR